MEYTKTVEVNVGDWVSVVTNDGLMSGEVKECKPNSVVVYIEEFEGFTDDGMREVEIKFVRL